MVLIIIMNNSFELNEQLEDADKTIQEWILSRLSGNTELAKAREKMGYLTNEFTDAETIDGYECQNTYSGS
jgi:hypothetical protein